jgi:hypothetical protein
MCDRATGRALVEYRGEAAIGPIVPAVRSSRAQTIGEAETARPLDRRKPGRLPDRLSRGLLVDRFA